MHAHENTTFFHSFLLLTVTGMLVFLQPINLFDMFLKCFRNKSLFVYISLCGRRTCEGLGGYMGNVG